MNIKELYPIDQYPSVDEMVKDFRKLQTQKAIECLKEVKEKINKDIIIAEDYFEIIDIIDNKIKELEGEDAN